MGTTRLANVEQALASGAGDSDTPTMNPPGFRFELPAAASQLEPAQLSALDLLAETIRRIQPADLDLRRTEVALDDGDLFVLLPHRSVDDFAVVLTVKSDEAVVVRSVVDHAGASFTFFSDDPKVGRLWPVAAPSYVEAAGGLIRELLLGRVEVEVRRGLLFRGVRSYLVEGADERARFQREVEVSPRLLIPTRSVVRVDFGPGKAGGHTTG